MRTLLVLSGMNTDPRPATRPDSPHYSAFAAEMAVLAARHGWRYESLDNYVGITLDAGAAALRARLKKLADQPVTIVASSYGCWIALLALSGRWKMYPQHHLVLVDPYVDSRNVYDPLPWYGKLFARALGFPRKGENGKRGFWVAPWVVDSMLAARNNIFDSVEENGAIPRLAWLACVFRSQVKVLFVGESSSYKPHRTTEKLLSALNTRAEPILPADLPNRVIAASNDPVASTLAEALANARRVS